MQLLLRFFIFKKIKREGLDAATIAVRTIFGKIRYIFDNSPNILSTWQSFADCQLCLFKCWHRLIIQIEDENKLHHAENALTSLPFHQKWILNSISGVNSVKHATVGYGRLEPTVLSLRHKVYQLLWGELSRRPPLNHTLPAVVPPKRVTYRLGGDCRSGGGPPGQFPLWVPISYVL